MSIMRRRFMFLCLLALGTLLETGAWVAPPTVATRTRSTRHLDLQTRHPASISEPETDVLGGVNEFDAWFAASPDAFCLPSVQHMAFDSLRGLTYTDERDLDEQSVSVCSVPREFILKASYSDPDWDVQLAQQLWDEFQKGKKSEVYGYCALLAHGTPLPVPDSILPPSTAPDALRHWSEEQKSMLESSVAGKKLLDTQIAQEQQWRDKFSRARNMSWNEFQWAMEAVHSRAFCGDFSGVGGLSVGSVAAPVLAAIAGWAFLYDNPDPSDVVLLGLGLIAGAPALLNLLDNNQGDAVLLPFIDSANHLQSADSTIEYDPLKGTMSLRIGPKCLVKEEGGETQLYVNYGPKTDLELLLNYGFLPGVRASEGTRGGEQRKRLSEAFMARNA